MTLFRVASAGWSQTPRSSDDTKFLKSKTVNSNNSNDITGNENTIVEGDQKVIIKVGGDINFNLFAGSPPADREYRVVDIEGTANSKDLQPAPKNINVTSAGDHSNEQDSQPISSSIPRSNDSGQSARSSVTRASDSETDTYATPSIYGGFTRSAIADSVASSSRNMECVYVTSENVENHIPEKAAAYTKCYMSTDLFNDKTIIPLWEPSPSIDDIHSHPRTWKKHVTIGDVGLFNKAGGFDTFFNIFLTFEENRDHGYKPPPNFLRFCAPSKLCLLMKDLECNEREPAIKWKGFVVCDDESESPDDWIRLKHPEDKKGVKCSALNMAHGFHKIEINQFDSGHIEKWAKVNQDDWHRHFDFATSNGHSKRFLLLITTCYRAKSWASASITLPPQSSQRRPLRLQKDNGNGINKGYTWSTRDRDIMTNCGPSSSQTRSMMSYFEDLDNGIEPCDSKTRKETEECNCIAIQAFFIQKKFLGIPLGLRRSTRSSVLSGNRSIFSRFTQLTVTKASPSEQKTVQAVLKGVFNRSKLGQ